MSSSLRTCSVEGCSKPVRARALCGMHWQRWRKAASADEVQPYRQMCTVHGCTRKNFGLGYCQLHYGRIQRHGDPLVALAAPRTKTGMENHQWKGSDLGYRSAHDRIEYRRGKARDCACVHCGTQAWDWAYDHADPNELAGHNGPYWCLYSADPDHYIPLCRSCHIKWDRSFAMAGESN